MMKLGVAEVEVRARDNSSDNTALYVVGGLAVVGIIAYVVISKKIKKLRKKNPILLLHFNNSVI